MIVWLLLSVLLAGLILLLCLPVEVEVSTDDNLYRARWKGIFAFRVVPDMERWRFYWQLFFFEKEFRPGHKKQTEPQQPAGKKRSPLTPRQGWRLFRNLLRTIEVRRLRVNLDTDDFARNAILYPLLQALSQGNRQLSTNFHGDLELSMLLRVRPYRVAGALWQTFVHPKLFRS